MQKLLNERAYFREMAIRTMFGLAALEEESPDRRRRLVALLKPVRESVVGNRPRPNAAFPPLVEMAPKEEVTDALRRRYASVFSILDELDANGGRLKADAVRRAQEEGDRILAILEAMS